MSVVRGNESSNASVLIDNCRFLDNERGLTVLGPFNNVVVRNCLFAGNKATHAGAAILVLVSKTAPVAIDNCTFTNNVAGRYRDYYSMIEDEDSLKMIRDEVHLNTSCCKGVIMLVGKGGAIRIQRGNVTLSNSRFINNTARLLGSSVFVDIDGTLTIWNSYFENTDKHDHALQGDVLFSDGNIEINKVKIIIRTAVNGLSLVRHSGVHWSLAMTNVWIQCPVGYDLRTTNSSAYGVTPDGLRRSYYLDQLSYFCESCPRNKYSLDFGYLNYTMVFSKFVFFSLLINGDTPKAEYTGNYIHHEIQCKECPYGGQCVQGIRAVANFWGFVINGSVRFQHCPKGYCCSANECLSIDSCTLLRQGRLCGKCQDGFSEAWFSTTCVPNDSCGPLWMFPLSVTLGLLYVVFLVFQGDIKKFIFAGPEIHCCAFAGWSKSLLIGNSKYDHRHLDEHVGTIAPSTQLELVKMNDCSTPHDTTSTHPMLFKDDNEMSNGDALHWRRRNQPERDSGEQEPPVPEITCVDFGCIVTLVYYFQDALLLNVRTVDLTPDSRIHFLTRSILFGLFKFELDVFELLHTTCAAPDMTPVPKVVSQALLIVYMLSVFGLMYLLRLGMRLVRRERKVIGVSVSHPTYQTSSSIDTKLVSGTLLTLLFMYQKIGTTTFTLLNCVPADGEQVLFLDGTITCYQYWQYAVLTYAIACVTPFCLVLMTGPSLLQSGRIPLWQFLVACLCPLPFLAAWGFSWTRVKRKDGGPPPRRYPLTNGELVVMQILQGPFKTNRYGFCWAGVLVGRRLILILLFTFVNDTLLRLLAMLLVCSVILLHHVDVQPYKETLGNNTGTVSAAALVTLAIINLVRAAFEAAEYHPTGPYALLMRIFTEIETMLLIWIPLTVIALIALLCIVRFIALLTRSNCCRRGAQPNRRQESKDNRSQPW